MPLLDSLDRQCPQSTEVLSKAHCSQDLAELFGGWIAEDPPRLLIEGILAQGSSDAADGDRDLDDAFEVELVVFLDDLVVGEGRVLTVVGGVHVDRCFDSSPVLSSGDADTVNPVHDSFVVSCCPKLIHLRKVISF